MFPHGVQRVRCCALIAGILAAICTARVADAATRYKITTLEPLPGGMDSIATAINELGVVVGHSRLDRSGNIGQSRPVMWDSSGRPTPLWEEGPSMPGAIPAAINNAGQVVGQYHFGSGIPLPSTDLKQGRAFIWDAENGMRDLGSLGGSRIEATGINEQGQVAGSSYLANRQGIHAFIWDEANGMESLGTLGSVISQAAAINNHGQIAGTSWLADDSERAFLWDPVIGMRDLGTLGGNLSRGAGVNDVGDVVGFSSIDAGFGGAFLYQAGVMVHLSSTVPFSRAHDVNILGEIVGAQGGGAGAVIWDQINGTRDLHSLISSNLGWRISDATAINNRGQIVGHGWLNDEIRAFLLTPIPEPSTAVLGILGALVAALSVWFRKTPSRICLGSLRSSRSAFESYACTCYTKGVYHGPSTSYWRSRF